MEDKDVTVLSKVKRWSPTKVLLTTFLLGLFFFFIIDACTNQYSLQFISTIMSFLAHLNVLLMTVLFLIITSISVIFCFPTGILGLSGGYLFGLKFGFTVGFMIATIINLVGNSLGCAMTYRVSIWLVSESQPFTKEDIHPILWGIRKALEKKGRHINILLRLTPIVPGAVINYVLPPLGTKFDDFVFGSFVGTIPYALLLSILGSMLNDSTSIETFLYHTSIWITIPVLLVAFTTLFLGIYLTYKYAKEALQSAIIDDDDIVNISKPEESSLLGEYKHEKV